jgi:class 3 adenylate cyclase
VNTAPPNYRFAAILSVDVADYTAMTRRDEPGTVAAVRDLLAALAQEVAARSGRVFKTVGDGFLAEFGAAALAVDAALALQALAAARQRGGPRGRRLSLRAGVDAGDVIAGADGDLFGDVVNTAQRIQSVAPLDEVAVAERVAEELRTKPAFALVALDEYDLKGVGIVVPYRVRRAETRDRTRSPMRRAADRSLHAGRLGLFAVLIVFGLAIELRWVGFPMYVFNIPKGESPLMFESRRLPEWRSAPKPVWAPRETRAPSQATPAYAPGRSSARFDGEWAGDFVCDLSPDPRSERLSVRGGTVDFTGKVPASLGAFALTGTVGDDGRATLSGGGRSLIGIGYSAEYWLTFDERTVHGYGETSMGLVCRLRMHRQ